MEGGNLQKPPEVGYPADSDDAKYVSGLSTILVATIQEAKDRISQIEYIFCSQLYPNFQSKSKCLQKIYSETRKAAENDYKEKEKNLLLQLEKLQEELKEKTKETNEGKEAQQNLEKLLSAKDVTILSKDNMLRELEERNLMLLNKQKSLELEVDRLQFELTKKSKEDDGEMELQNKLLRIVESKVSMIAHKDKQLIEHEKKEKELCARLESTVKICGEIKLQLQEKTAEVEKGKDLHENLLKKIESQDSEIMQNEQLLIKYQKENRLLIVKVENLENKVGRLRTELQSKTKEVEEGGKLREQLVQQINLYNLERSKTEQELEDLEKKNVQLLAKLKGLEEKVDKLQEDLQERRKESCEGIELHGKFIQQIETKDTELQSEKNKFRDLVDAYKKLKSQYNFLCTRIPVRETRDGAVGTTHSESPITLHDIENKIPDAPGIACELTKWKDEPYKSEDGKRIRSIQETNSILPSTSGIFINKKSPAKVKSCPPAGSKRPASYWRDTRSHQSRAGSDLHDDFLDTPLESIKRELGKANNNEFQDLPRQVPEDMNLGNSDDETEDINVDPGPEKVELPPSRPEASGFKYVGPVRKKAEREKLKGIECKQCRKFYDAVLPNEGKDSNGNKQNLRCEHHDGVSRHRYRYAPPLTPDGFWNIGFESEM